MPRWIDDPAWSEAYRRAFGRPAQQRMIFQAWVAAAGGELVDDDGDLRLILPPDLPDCRAKFQLRWIADQMNRERRMPRPELRSQGAATPNRAAIQRPQADQPTVCSQRETRP
jgi:hypothetical protein